MSNIPPKPTEEETRTEAQLEDILERVSHTPFRISSPFNDHQDELIPNHQRSALLSHLTRLLDSEASASALKSTNLARHREILTQHGAELRRIKSQISSTRDRANLLSNVRSDINAYRSQHPEDAEAEYMLQERGRIDNSHSMADSVLSQAYAINENFGLQRETLANINRRIVGAASQVPGINGLIQRIGTKKRRDGIILGSFIAFCFLMFFFFS